MDLKNLNLNNIKNNDSLVKKLGIILGIVIIIFCIFIGIKLLSGSRISYESIESRMITAAKNYYKKNPDKLPKEDGGYVSIGTDRLIESKYLKSLDKLVKDKEATCTGEVTVTNNNDLLLYEANLNCGKYYETKKLKNVLTENVVTSGNGIYNINNSYVFRGDSVDNYISFAKKTWRILRVNSDGTIRMIETTKRNKVEWDDRYNSDKQYNIGINDYRVSRIKNYIEEIYNNDDEFSNDDKAYLVNQNLCIGKRNDEQTNNDGSIECSDVIENQPLGLIQINEFALASLDNKCQNPNDPECSNYNYLADFNTSYWSLTADSNTSYKVYKISNYASLSNAINQSQPKLVITLNSNISYVSGDGTETNPYKIK